MNRGSDVLKLERKALCYTRAVCAVLALLAAACVLPDARLEEPAPPAYPFVPPSVSAVAPSVAAPVCGNGRKEGAEECDGLDVGNPACASKIPGALGMLRCIACRLDQRECTVPPAGSVCGNGKKEDGELCDGADFGGVTCEASNPGSTSMPTCTPDCHISLHSCIGVAAEIGCGNRKQEGDEECDGADFGGATCGFVLPGSTGELTCTADCKISATTCLAAPSPPRCGNGKREGDEVCDAPDFGDTRTCASLMPGAMGELRCNASCLLDTMMCRWPVMPRPGGSGGDRGGSGAR